MTYLEPRFRKRDFVPITITIKLQFPVFPAVSVEVQFTVVSPTRNSSPDEGMQSTETSASTLSVAVEVSTTEDEKLNPVSVAEDIFGQLRIGASSSVNNISEIRSQCKLNLS